jgi:hypothetical protein
MWADAIWVDGGGSAHYAQINANIETLYGNDPGDTRCRWEITCSSIPGWDDGGYVRVELLWDDTWIVSLVMYNHYTGHLWVGSYGPIVGADPYGTYSVTLADEGLTSTATLTLSARVCESGNACLSYVKVGETWDVVRICVEACALPLDYANGWLEDGPGGEADYFNVHVETMPVVCADCVWDATWVDKPFCATKWWREYGGEWQIGDTFALNHCGFWPDNTNTGSCTLYNIQASKWVRGAGDNDTLSVRWDGVWEYNFDGGSSIDTNASGPWGWYEFGDEKVEVYECSPG